MNHPRQMSRRKKRSAARTQNWGAAAAAVRAQPAPAPAARDWVPPEQARFGQQQLLQQLQSSHGNQFVQRLLLTRSSASVQRAGGAPAPPTQAAQEAQAKNSTTNIKNTINTMLSSPKPIVANTAKLIHSTGSPFARLDFKPMTIRSDSAALLAKKGKDPTKYHYFFYGEKQDNKHLRRRNVAGTIEGDKTLIIRELDNSGTPYAQATMISFIVHEASHMLSEVYDDFPKSDTNDASFDRYKDEFRAYWVETSPSRPWAALAGAAKAHSIRDHLVGKSATDAAGYPALKKRYWKNNKFKSKIDGHLQPDGYNLALNPNLDRLAVLIHQVKKRKSKVDDVLAHISNHMAAAERAEAEASDYFKPGNQAWKALGKKNHHRVIMALHSPNFHKAARMVDDIKAGKATFDQLLIFLVRSLTAAERADIAANDYFKKGGPAETILGAANHQRMMKSLNFMKVEHIAEGVNPNKAAEVGYFLSAIATRNENAIKINYKNMPKKERARIYHLDAAYVLAFLDQHVDDAGIRAAVHAMITGAGVKQYDAMKAFLAACAAAKVSKATALTGDIRATFKKLTDRSRWGLFLDEKARAEYIDPLPEALSKPIIKALRR